MERASGKSAWREVPRPAFQRPNVCVQLRDRNDGVERFRWSVFIHALDESDSCRAPFDRRTDGQQIDQVGRDRLLRCVVREVPEGDASVRIEGRPGIGRL